MAAVSLGKYTSTMAITYSGEIDGSLWFSKICYIMNHFLAILYSYHVVDKLTHTVEKSFAPFKISYAGEQIPSSR